MGDVWRIKSYHHGSLYHCLRCGSTLWFPPSTPVVFISGSLRRHAEQDCDRVMQSMETCRSDQPAGGAHEAAPPSTESGGGDGEQSPSPKPDAPDCFGEWRLGRSECSECGLMRYCWLITMQRAQGKFEWFFNR